MKYKYIFLFCTIMILSISAVSAADNTTEDIQIDDTIGDLTDLQTLIDEDTSNYVNLTGNYVGDSNNKTVVINKNITIDGNGYAVDYLSNKPLFDLQADNITFYNLVIKRHNNALGQKTVFTGDITESNPIVKNTTFRFDNELPTIFANNLTKNYKNSTQFYATIVDANNQTLANTTVTFYVNGVYYNRTTDSNGRAKLNINLSPGTYIITSTNTVTNETRQNIIEVRFGNSIIAYNLYKYCKDDSRPFHATALDYDGNPLANVTITFEVNNVIYNRTTEFMGHATLNINLLPGEYNITSTNTVTGQSTSNLIRVMSPFVEANDLVKKYNTDTQFKVKLVPYWGDGETVTFHVNGVSYNRTTDVFCVAALNINLMPGQYIIASTFNKYTEYHTLTVLES
ncbi:MAG: carboxypeptidase-like regulatory domain-containing protein [Methanobrevibacter sp.]|nr:carboxypeptidase-like regulatory domain-containing protein [Methanobrevibacter sp.]